MHRFRGNIWYCDFRPQVMNTLGCPLQVKDRILKITNAKNIKLDLYSTSLLNRMVKGSFTLNITVKWSFTHIEMDHSVYHH